MHILHESTLFFPFIMPATLEFKEFMEIVFSIAIQFPCPHCNIPLFPKDYEIHCRQTHNKSFYTLPSSLTVLKEKCRVNYILKYWKNISEMYRGIAFFPDACSEKDLFGRRSNVASHPMAYESAFEPKPEWYVPVTAFANRNLNLAASCVKSFIASNAEWDWFHVQIPDGVAFHSFYAEMEKDECVLLPFWCWNDSHHPARRHVILCWRKKDSNDPLPHWTYTSFMKSITGPEQLVDTIGMLSQRVTANHYWINVSLPTSFKWIIAWQWSDAVIKLSNSI